MSLWTGKPSRSLKTFQPFGSTVYVRDHTQTNKLKPRYVKAILLGWRPLSDSIVKFWHRETNTFGYSRDVVHGLPDGSHPNATAATLSHRPPPSASVEASADVMSKLDERRQERLPNRLPMGTAEQGQDPNTFANEEEDQDNIDEALTGADSPVATSLELPNPAETSVAPKKPKPKSGKGYHYETVAVDPSKDPHDELTQHVPTTYIDQSGRRVLPRRNKTLQVNMSDHNDENHGSHVEIRRSALLARADTQNPNTYLQARRSSDWPEWEKAITEELSKMDKYEVWEIVPRTPAMRTLKAKWVFTRKIDGTTGLPSTFKARWVAKGFNQVEGVDFNEIFSSVAHKDSIRVS